MARLDIMDLISGTFGDVIIYKRGGKVFMRSRPKEVRQPNTPAQLTARDKFRKSSALAKALFKITPQIGKEIDPNEVKSGYHSALGLIRNTGFKSEAESVVWDWESLVISEGSLPDLEIGSNRVGNRLELTWDMEAGSTYDELLFVSINTKTATPDSMSVAITDRKAQFELEKNEVLYVFRHQFKDDYMFKSKSLFLG